MRCIAIGAVSILWGLCLTVHAETIIHAGRLINGRDDKVHEVMSLVIDHGRIVAVREGYVDPTSDDQLFDLRDCTVMPGWMDMHAYACAYWLGTQNHFFAVNDDPNVEAFEVGNLSLNSRLNVERLTDRPPSFDVFGGIL